MSVNKISIVIAMNILGRVFRQSLPLSSQLGRISAFSTVAPTPPEAIEKLLSTNKVVVFMKGNPDVIFPFITLLFCVTYLFISLQAPRCGFSNAVVQIMRMHGVPYDSYDILQDEALRQGRDLLSSVPIYYLNLNLFPGIKDYSNWPTIPQVFLNKEFIGGCDILLQMHQNGELIEELEKIGIKSALTDKAEEEKK